MGWDGIGKGVGLTGRERSTASNRVEERQSTSKAESTINPTLKTAQRDARQRHRGPMLPTAHSLSTQSAPQQMSRACARAHIEREHGKRFPTNKGDAQRHAIREGGLPHTATRDHSKPTRHTQPPEVCSRSGVEVSDNGVDVGEPRRAVSTEFLPPRPSDPRGWIQKGSGAKPAIRQIPLAIPILAANRRPLSPTPSLPRQDVLAGDGECP